MPTKDRRSFPESFKKEMVEAYLAKKKTLTELAAAHDLYPHQILRWKDKYHKQSSNGHAHLDHDEPEMGTHSASQADPRDRLIHTLRSEIGGLYMRVKELENQLGFKRRFNDQPAKAND